MSRTNSRRIRATLAALGALALASGAVLAQPHNTHPAGGANANAGANAGGGTTPSAADHDAALSPAEQERRAQVVARVGETSITLGEFEDMLNEAPPPVRATYMDPARRRDFLENIIRTTLLADEAKRRGLDRNPEVSAAIRRVLAQKLQQEAVLNAVTLESITDEEVRTYYQAHVSDYQQPEYRRATVLYLNDRAGAEQAATEARNAHGDMRRIQTMVRERSQDDASRGRDGDLFYFRRDGGATAGGAAVDPAVAAAAFGLAREMDVSAPVQAGNGKFAIVVLTGIRPALSRTVGDPGVANSIRGFIMRERRTQREQQLLEEIRNQMHPEVHEDRLDLIRLPQADLGNVPPFDPMRSGHGAAPVPRGTTPGTNPIPRPFVGPGAPPAVPSPR